MQPESPGSHSKGTVKRGYPMTQIQVIGAVVIIVIVVIMAVLKKKHYKKEMTTLTAQAVPAVTDTQEVRTPSYDSDGQYDGDDVSYTVNLTYDAGGQAYAAQGSLSESQYKSGFLNGMKVCYNPADPTEAALAPSNFVVGSSARGAVIIKGRPQTPKAAV